MTDIKEMGRGYAVEKMVKDRFQWWVSISAASNIQDLLIGCYLVSKNYCYKTIKTVQGMF
jgi:hypothetical protein